MYLKIFFFFTFLVITAWGESSDEDDDDNTYSIGDMIFNRKIDEMMSNQSSRAGATHTNQHGQSYDISWPDNIIPYTWHSDMPADKKSMIQSAMKDIMSAVPNCWKFVEKTSEHKHWVEYNTVKRPNSCSSAVGNWAIAGNPPQLINFGAEFCKHGSMVHELFHTMGFQHEFTRNDRDDYIDVFFERIPQESQNNFILDEKSGFTTDYYKVPYNFESIMHYGLSLEGMIQNPVMKNKGNKAAWGYDLPDEKIGQRYKFSKGDLLMMARKGKCPDPKIKSYPVTGASPNDVGVAEDNEPRCHIMDCSKVKGTCPSNETTEHKKCTGKGQCGMYKTICCKK